MTDCTHVIINDRNSINNKTDELIDFTDNPHQDEQDFDAFIIEYFISFPGKKMLFNF